MSSAADSSPLVDFDCLDDVPTTSEVEQPASQSGKKKGKGAVSKKPATKTSKKMGTANASANFPLMFTEILENIAKSETKEAWGKNEKMLARALGLDAMPHDLAAARAAWEVTKHVRVKKTVIRKTPATTEEPAQS